MTLIQEKKKKLFFLLWLADVVFQLNFNCHRFELRTLSNIGATKFEKRLPIGTFTFLFLNSHFSVTL